MNLLLKFAMGVESMEGSWRPPSKAAVGLALVSSPGSSSPAALVLSVRQLWPQQTVLLSAQSPCTPGVSVPTCPSVCPAAWMLASVGRTAGQSSTSFFSSTFEKRLVSQWEESTLKWNVHASRDHRAAGTHL